MTDKTILVPAHLQSRVQSEQTELLYKAMPVSVTFSIINASIIAFIQWGVIDHAIIIAWLSATVAIYLGRGVVAILYVKREDRHGNNDVWLHYFLIGTFLSGVAWGGASFFLFPEDNVAHQVFIAFVIAGMTAGASSSLSARYETAIAFIVPAILFLIIKLMIVGSTISYMMMVMTVLFMVQVLNSTKRTYINTCNNIVLKLQSIEREEILRQSEERFDALVNNSMDAIFMHDQHGVIIDINQRACDTLGYTRNELLRMTVFDIEKGITQDDLNKIWKKMKNGESVRLEGMHHRKDGSFFPVEISLGMFEKKGDNFILASVRDITERKRREDALNESRQKLSLHIQQTPLAVIEWSTDFKVTEWNPAAEKIFGFTKKEAIGHHAAGLIVPESIREHVEDVWKALMAQRGGLRSTNENITKDGTSIICEWYNTPLIDEHNKVIGVASLAQDITARKQAEDSILLAKEEAEKANRVKSEFLSRMSHELRTPMNAILGFGQLLLPEMETEEHKEYMQEIIIAGNHLLKLINEVLDLSRIENSTLDLSLGEVEIGQVLRESLTLVKPLADARSITLTDRINAEPVNVYSDLTRLKQVMINLLSNAIKYNRSGGSVTIKSETIGTRAKITVEDTGNGISKDKQKYLFTPFERLGAENSGIEGTGIGLVITKQLVEMMGGSIGMESDEGEGARFWLELNLAGSNVLDIHNKPETVSINQEEVTEGTHKKILYIEDNPANMKLVESVMNKRSNVELITANRPELGVDLAIAHLPDLILLDINLPGMDGYQVMKKLLNNKSTRQIPVIAITANAMESDIAKGKEAGFRHYLTKPIDVKRLLDVVDTTLSAV